MRNLLFIILSLTTLVSLFADSFDNNSEVEKYLVDSTYYDQFSSEVLGIYVLYDEVPIKIYEDTNKMAQILSRFISLKDNTNTKIVSLPKEFNTIKKTKLFNRFSQKHMNHHIELRDIDWMLADDKKMPKALYDSLNQYIKKKKEYFARQNNEDAEAFFTDIEKTILKPLIKVIQKIESQKIKIREDYNKQQISSLNKKELKLVWDEFKENNLGLIQTYFDANKKKLKQLDENNSFEINLNDVEWDGMPKFYICLNIFGQKWHLRIDDYYVSGLHKVNLIKL
jgi:hypothetical protein